MYKNTFGHVLIIAGSRTMIGAGVLASLASMRSGAGLTTLALPKSLNLTAHKKLSSVIMTLPLPETKDQTIAQSAHQIIKKNQSRFTAVAIGPGLSQNKSTAQLIRTAIEKLTLPLVVDADALNALGQRCAIIKKRSCATVITPHPGEMARLTGIAKSIIEKKKKEVAENFAKQYNCTVLLKGHHTIIASPNKKTYINKTGNPGMATAGSGDVLTGMIAAFLAQGLSSHDAARYASYLHGKAGDIAAKKKTKAALIASDIIESIPAALKKR